MTNEEEFKAWLKGQTKAVHLAIAYRAAMRVLPFAMDLDQFDGADRLALATFRALLTSGVAAVCPTPDFTDYVRASALSAARSAAFSADSAALSDSVARSAAFSAFSALSAAHYGALSDSAAFSAADSAARSSHSAALSAAYADADLDPDTLADVEILLPVEIRALIDIARSHGRSALDAGGPWLFWAKWYAAAMRGEPLDWKLQEQFALISDEVWEHGVEAVAEAIDEIKREYDASKLDDDVARKQAEGLTKASSHFAAIAGDAAEILETNITKYKADADENRLPDGFQACEDIVPVFRSIRTTLLSGSAGSELVDTLQKQIQELDAKVVRLQDQLRDERLAYRTLALTQNEAERDQLKGKTLLTTLAELSAIGALLLAAGVVIGNVQTGGPYQSAKLDMIGLAEEMCAAEATEPVPDVPDDPTVEV